MKDRLRAAALICCLTIMLSMLAACGPATVAQTPGGTVTAASSAASAAPAPTDVPAAQPTSAPPSAPAAQPTSAPPSAAPTGSGLGLAYVDNRSDGASVIQSFYNAIGRREYARAYAYWQNTAGVPAFPEFKAGYEQTESVQLTIGSVGGSAGAGQFRYTVPVVIRATAADASTQTFAGCYTLHLASPDAQGQPPFQPMGIESASVQQIASSADTTAALAQACAAQNQQQGAAPIPPRTDDPADISAQRYLDDRSGPLEVVRSLYNAINSRQYVRAYAYWQAPSGAPSGPPPFDQFQQGYATTQSVQLTTGEVNENAGAGQYTATVPVTVVATQTDGSQQTFVGCYRLHLANPGMQEQPPFQPWGIADATIAHVAGDANPATLMGSACQGS